jgi:hypothetical protein
MDLINKMRRSAEVATEQLGLPPEAKYDLLGSMYASPDAFSLFAEHNSWAEPNPALYEVVIGFLAGHMKDQIKAFQALWKQVYPAYQRRPAREYLACRFVEPWYWAGGDSELQSVIKVMSLWFDREEPADEQAIVEHAISVGCSAELGQLIAQYLAKLDKVP